MMEDLTGCSCCTSGCCEDVPEAEDEAAGSGCGCGCC